MLAALQVLFSYRALAAAQPVVHAASAPQLLFTAVDTMKESRDTETRPLTTAQIAQDVDLSATLHAGYITVNTHWDYPGYMQRWVQAVRATGRHVWFRIHPNQWADNNGTTGIMSPAAYTASEQAFITAHAALFQPGDTLSAHPETPKASVAPSSTGTCCGHAFYVTS